MNKVSVGVLSLLAAFSVSNAVAKEFAWPGNAKAAVNLAYDDGLNSQLDNVIPALDKYGFKGSFYVPIASGVLDARLAEWRSAAANGHELGNHSIYHQCSASKPNREWVEPRYDLDKTTFDRHVDEIRLANWVLYAIDGKRERTFTAPCGDLIVEGKNYIEAVKGDFVAIKAAQGIEPTVSGIDPAYVKVVVPEGVTGAQLIAVVKEAAKKGTIANFTFHGIGGDHLVVSTEAHNELLQYLADNKDIYWVDTFLNIMKHVNTEKAAAR